MQCPTCKKILIIDPAGTKVWHCSNCKYGWRDDIIRKANKKVNLNCTYEDHILQKMDGQINCGFCDMNLNSIT